jgi:Cu/Ag efflux protein CusF
MIKFWRLCTALLLSVSSVGFANAQMSAPQGKTGEVKPDAEKASASKTVSGTVKSASMDTVIVTGMEQGGHVDWSFAVDLKTVIKKKSKSIVATNLKPGDRVQVKYSDQDGRALARTISVKAAAPAKKQAKKPYIAEPVEKK